MIETTERAHQVIDVAIAFSELIHKAGVKIITHTYEGKVSQIFLSSDFFKTAFPSVTPTIAETHNTYDSLEYTINYNGIKFIACGIKWKEGGENDTVQTYSYPE